MNLRIRFDAPPTVGAFMDSDDFVRFILGPVGSGKSSGCVMELLKRAVRQAPGRDGIRRTRWAVIRNTYRELQDTTRKTFEQWIPPQLGEWHEQSFTFTARFKDVEAEVLFRALDRPEDIKKLLSLELTGAYINEAREIPKQILDALQARVGRFPSQAEGDPTWYGIWADSNPWHDGHWGQELFKRQLPGFSLFRQPGGRSEGAENVENLPGGYYERLCIGKDAEWIRVYVDGLDASGAVGAVYGELLSALDARGGIGAFDHPKDGIFTGWDLGISDSTAIWWWRIREGTVDLLDHYEAHGFGASHYFDELDSRPYEYVKHFLPHDARARTFQTGVTIQEQFAERYPGKVAITPQISLADGISAARWLLEQPMRIHARCGDGVKALRSYRYEWDENKQVFSKTPVHDWSSHTADAFRYVATAYRFSDILTRQPPKPKPFEPKVDITLDEMWEHHERTRANGRERIR